MAIPSQFIDELIFRADIQEVVGDYVTLNRKGGSYWGLCPFHGEKTPSFHVVPERQRFHCFGCGKGGGVISFVMEMENLPYPDAIHHLAKRFGMTVPEDGEGAAMSRMRARLLALNRAAAHWFHKQLHEPSGAEGLSYLGGRGLSPGLQKRFGLGYAPARWDGLLTAMRAEGFDSADLLRVGLVVSGEKGRMYDRFRDRVMFPILDIRGEVVGFGGRILGEGSPKYLNSPDSPVFAKNQQLFAMHRAKNTKRGQIILTEGYMDTIALHQAGFDNAVASLGTAFTSAHAKLISRFTKEVVLAFDSDEAGKAAAARAIPLLEAVGLHVRVLAMEGAKDPDEYMRKFGRTQFEALVEGASDHIPYQLAQIRSRHRMEEPEERIAYIREAAAFLGGISSAIEREVYAGRVAMECEIASDVVLREAERAAKDRMNHAKKKQLREVKNPSLRSQPKARELRYDNIRSALAEEGLVRLLLLDESLYPAAKETKAEEFSSSFLAKVYGLICTQYEEGRKPGLDSLAEALTATELSQLSVIMQESVDMARARVALSDYQETITREALMRSEQSDEARNRVLMEYHRKKKGDVMR